MMERERQLSHDFTRAATALVPLATQEGGRGLLAQLQRPPSSPADPVAIVSSELNALCASRAAVDRIATTLTPGIADVVMVWAESVASRPDLVLSPLLVKETEARRSIRTRAAKARLLHGPMFDALHALPNAWSAHKEPQVALRIRQLIWEAGARGLTLPVLGEWLWSSPSAVEALILEPARRHLGDRLLAARAFALVADGFSEDRAPALSRAVVELALELRDDSEPLVWTAAARGLGRMAGGSSAARMTVFRGATSARLHERRRNLASIASLPLTLGAESWIDERVAAVLDEDARREDPWRLAALAVATPHLARDRPELWDRLCRVALESPSLELSWSLAKGLAILARHSMGHGWVTREEAVARSLRAHLVDRAPQAANEIARQLDAIISVDRALGTEPVMQTCFDAFDMRIYADIEGVSAPEPQVPRIAFEESLADLASDNEGTRGKALLATRAATLAHAMHLPELVLGLETLDSDTDEMLRVCRERLAADACDYATRSALVKSITDLVAGASEHGRAAAKALRALAQSRWVSDLGDLARDPKLAKDMRREVQRFRRPLEDLFRTCLTRTTVAAVAEDDTTVPAPVAAWWALCAGPASVLGPIERLPRTDQNAALDHAIGKLELALRNAAFSVRASEWGPRAMDALSELDSKATVLADVFGRLITAIERLDELSSVDGDDHARDVLENVTSACQAMLALGDDLDAALASTAARVPGRTQSTEPPAWIAGGGGAISRVSISDPWDRLAPGLRAIVAPKARALAQRFAVRPSFIPGQGARFGNYELVKLIGRGGMGEVWRANWQGVRAVALKLPRADVPRAHRQRLAESLRAEAATLMRLNFARVATLLDSGVIDETPYLATTFIRGRTLADHLIKDEAAQPAGAHLPLVIDIVNDICIGLDNLHRHGLVHRDLKPGNVMLRMGGREDEPLLTIEQDPRGREIDEAMLIDFGIAHEFNASGDRGVSPGYASPEAVRWDAVGPAADIYALGATLFHVMTGRSLCGDEMPDLAAMMWHLTTEPFENEEVLRAAAVIPPRIREAIEGACKLDPNQRISLRRFRGLVCD
jgi:tRNA A-37 threonylcarbamoyl transferase component Bud32